MKIPGFLKMKSRDFSGFWAGQIHWVLELNQFLSSNLTFSEVLRKKNFEPNPSGKFIENYLEYERTQKRKSVNIFSNIFISWILFLSTGSCLTLQWSSFPPSLELVKLFFELQYFQLHWRLFHFCCLPRESQRRPGLWWWWWWWWLWWQWRWWWWWWWW